MRIVSLDYETYYDSEFSVKDLGYWKYARDPRCSPYLVSVCDGTESWAGEPKEFNFESLRDCTLLAHNRAFDEEISLGSAELGLFEVPNLKAFNQDANRWLCTADMSAYLFGVRSLKDASRIGLGEVLSKDVRNRASGKTPAQMKAEGWWDDMLKYGRSDAEKCWHLFNQHGHKWPQFERELSNLTIEQGRYGVQIDVEALDSGISALGRCIFNASLNLPWVERGFKPASPLGIAEECKKVGIPPPPVKYKDPEAAEDWENLHAPNHKFVMAIRTIRKAKKSLATLETIKLRIRPDDTVSFSLKYCGAYPTLRWAGDAGWNLQNQNREPLFFDSEFGFVFDKAKVATGVEEFDKEHKGKRAYGRLSDGRTFFDFRGLILARPGMALGAVDLAQIEPRVLNAIVGNEALLSQVRQGLAIYEAFARTSLGWTGGELKKENKKVYSLSKAEVLGLGFRMGYMKFIDAAWTLARVDITEGDEEFARLAAVDATFYQRVKNSRGDKWVYSGAPAGTDVLVDSAVVGEACVFIKRVRRVNGNPVESLLGVPVYGMRSRVTVEGFRKSNELIRGLWETFDDMIEAAADDETDLVVEGPHGGTMTYKQVRRESKQFTNPDTLEVYSSKVYTAEIGGRRYKIHGGIITENLVQWVARMVFAERMLDLHQALQADDSRQRVLFSVHDEAVPEILEPADPAQAKAVLEEMLSVTPTWLPNLPVGAEASISPRYSK